MAGQASYSLYLFNDIFQVILLKIPWLAPVYHLSPNLYLLLTMVIGGSVSILIYTYFEKPMIVLGKQLSQKLAQPYIGRQLCWKLAVLHHHNRLSGQIAIGVSSVADFM
jgi:peptidoglycan/LPS O-acetylase OafA/YrhL